MLMDIHMPELGVELWSVLLKNSYSLLIVTMNLGVLIRIRLDPFEETLPPNHFLRRR